MKLATKIEKLNEGLSRYITDIVRSAKVSKKFKAHIREERLTFEYMYGNYSLGFSAEKGKLMFLLKIKAESMKNGLVDKIKERLPTANELDKEKYFGRMDISLNEEYIKISVPLKGSRIGNNEYDFSKLYKSLLTIILSPAMNVVHEASKKSINKAS